MANEALIQRAASAAQAAFSGRHSLPEFGSRHHPKFAEEEVSHVLCTERLGTLQVGLFGFSCLLQPASHRGLVVLPRPLKLRCQHPLFCHDEDTVHHDREDRDGQERRQ